jgi:hypothetical protein
MPSDRRIAQPWVRDLTTAVRAEYRSDGDVVAV